MRIACVIKYIRFDIYKALKQNTYYKNQTFKTQKSRESDNTVKNERRQNLNKLENPSKKTEIMILSKWEV